MRISVDVAFSVIQRIVGCAHDPNDLAYFLYAADDLAITSQNLV